MAPSGSVMGRPLQSVLQEKEKERYLNNGSPSRQQEFIEVDIHNPSQMKQINQAMKEHKKSKTVKHKAGKVGYKNQ